MKAAGQTVVQKIFARHLGLPEVPVGQIYDITPDLVFSHDNSAAIIRLFNTIGVDKLYDPRRMAIFLDHAAPPPTTLHAQNHAEIRAFVRNNGIGHFYDVGEGICHQLVCEKGLVKPGDMVLGADSHSTHAGALGAFSAGVGRSEMAALWATGQLWLRVPESIRITLEGAFNPWVTTKDAALHIIGSLGAEAGAYRSVELGGKAIEQCTMAARFVLTNMMAEMGAKNAWIEADDTTWDWLEAHGVERRDAGNVTPDDDAVYEASYSFTVDILEPQIACPDAVDNVRPLSEVRGTVIQQAFLGTCTNARLEDIAVAAAVLKGRHVASTVRLLVIPASAAIFRQAIKAGTIEILLDAGAVINPPGCGPCMGNHLGVPAPGEVTVSTANRNFRGRMGTPDAPIYLASPAVVAASAVAGYLIHPAEIAPEGMAV
jgi:3-isopropylmalate/(R)-2-methylmalate dehydratase large subunit